MPDRESDAFSNPLAPAHMQDDQHDAQPLTNDDFRKLLMTPRAPTAKSAVAPTPVHRPTKSKDDDDAFAKRREKKIYYARLRKLEEERQKELNAKYRDRASERRSGQNKDYAETESISTTADYRAVAPTAQLDLGNAERRNQLIQESKYLGGDMEHTHLVKGLDYALLEKVRAEICQKEEEEEEDIERALEPSHAPSKEKQTEKEEDPEDRIDFRTRMGRNIFRLVCKQQKTERNELFAPGRMAYCVEVDDEYAESDIPTTVIRSKADIQNKEASTTLTTNDIVINKLTQILSYLRQGKRDKKKKLKEKAKMRDEGLMDEGIYGEMGDYVPSMKKDKERDHRDKSDRDRRDRDRDRDRDRERGDRDRQRSSRHERSSASDRKRSYFEKPVDEVEDVARNLPTSAKDLVDSINSRFASQVPQAQQASWTEKFPSAAEKAEAGEEGSSKASGGRSKKSMDSSYAECYPGLEEAYDALGDSDDEVDYTKMDQGNKKGPVGRWDFDTQEEYSDYMANKEALPKAAFQYGVKMADGRRTRRTGPKDQKKELDREWQKIQNIISKRKQMGTQGEPPKKTAKY